MDQVQQRVQQHAHTLLHTVGLHAGEEVAWCGTQTDLIQGGISPSLRGWAWRDQLGVPDKWRNRAIGGRLVWQAIAWAKLAHRDRVIVLVADYDEVAGAGCFYQRFRWDVMTRERHGWRGQ